MFIRTLYNTFRHGFTKKKYIHLYNFLSSNSSKFKCIFNIHTGNSEFTGWPSQLRVRVKSESESSDRVSGHLLLSNTIKMSFFDFTIYLWTVCIIILFFFAKSESTMAQQATTLIQKAESTGWNYRLANKNWLTNVSTLHDCLPQTRDRTRLLKKNNRIECHIYVCGD